MLNIFKRRSNWVMIELDARLAAKHGLPVKCPIPESEAARVQQQGPNIEQLFEWAKAFSREKPNEELTKGLIHFINNYPKLRSVEQWLKTEQWDKARIILEEILAADPNNMPAHFNIGAALRNLGDFKASLAHYEKSEPDFNDEGIFYTNRARTYEALGDKDKAIADYRKALDLMPGDEFTLDKLTELGAMVSVYRDPNDPSSKVYMNREDYTKIVQAEWDKHTGELDYFLAQSNHHLQDDKPGLALDAAERVLGVDPQNTDALLYKGLALWKLGSLDDAITILKQHLQLSPSSAWGYVNLAKVVTQRQGRDAARPYIEKTLELDPNMLDAIGMLVLPEDPENMPASIDIAREMVKRYPDAWAPWRVLGDVYLYLGNAVEAVKAYAEAVKRNPDDETWARYLGEIGKAGQTAEICKLADQYPEFKTRSARVRWNIALAFVSCGRTAEAKQILQKMIEIHDLSPETRQQCRQMLQSLEK